jgi:beta-galactosidase
LNFKITSNSFRLNNKDIFIYSGEIHYFRVPRKLWKKHLLKLKEANCNTVSTYIPWSWHEFKDNIFDFTGQTNSQRDLTGFLELCSELNLLVIVKPGPYILAEYKLHGIPEWLYAKHPEIQAVTEKGYLHPTHMSTYLHPVFLRYAKRWYKKVMPIIKKHQIYNNKSIIMMQLCNEIAFYYWISAEADYNRACLNYYHRFLKKHYKNIQSLNKVYKSRYKKFDSVYPPRGRVKSKKDYLRYRDWHLFYRWYYAKYLARLLKEVRALGIEVGVFHNLPGWIDGKAVEYPVNIIMYDRLKDIAPEVILGVDHIPEMVDFRNLGDDYICNEVTQAMQGRKFPTLGIEIQAGTRHHKTRVYPGDLELFYKTCLVHGMKGINLYMFSQGINPERQGSLGPVFYWQTPLDVEGQEGPLYETVKKIGKLIKTHGLNLINTERRSEICVGFYRPYYYTEFLIPAFGDRRINVYDLGLDYDAKDTRDFVLFNGILKSLKLLNQDFNMEDLQSVNLSTLKKYKQLWVVSLDYMDLATQKKLFSYVKDGGHLIIMPTLADKDLNLNKCSFLHDKFKIKRESVEFPIHPKVDLLGIKDFQGLSRINTYSTGDAEVIAETEDGKCCGLSKKAGKGRLTLLGTGFTYELEEHLKAYERLIQTDKLKRYTRCDNPDIITGQIFGRDYSYLYIFNYHRASRRARLTVENPKTKEKITLPDKEKMEIPATYGLITPVNLKLDENTTLKYTTSEVLSITKNDGELILEISGHPQIQGELKLICRKKPRKIFINRKETSPQYENREALLSYRHGKKPHQIRIPSS